MCWVYLSLLAALGIGIAYQDFKTRLFSIWLLIAFAIIGVSEFFLNHSIFQFAENLIFCLCYFLLCFLILTLYFFIKHGKFESVIKNKIGWADILLFLIIGSLLEPQNLIYFFTFSFIISLLIHLAFSGRNKSIPLAGFLSLSYFVYLFFENS